VDWIHLALVNAVKSLRVPFPEQLWVYELPTKGLYSMEEGRRKNNMKLTLREIQVKSLCLTKYAKKIA
jgi:hypothetical protein